MERFQRRPQKAWSPSGRKRSEAEACGFACRTTNLIIMHLSWKWLVSRNPLEVKKWTNYFYLSWAILDQGKKKTFYYGRRSPFWFWIGTWLVICHEFYHDCILFDVYNGYWQLFNAKRMYFSLLFLRSLAIQLLRKNWVRRRTCK